MLTETEFQTYAAQGILAEHLADAGVVIDGLCFQCGQTVPTEQTRLIQPETARPADVDVAMDTTPTIYSEARQRQRNNLRAHLAAYDKTLPVLPGELDPLGGKALATWGRAIRDRLDNEPVMPVVAHREQKFNPAPWMRHPEAKPVRRHAR